ncbi:SPRY domain-containing SOCS box protein 3 [Condylostylus longicornis]|uniref:SPRY domain-containing SOCS box protein 3 n=1 Tax=Condylostylus longicornis TaxID=2530218 RepID=UPI00244E557A|nr:SPRY domain-containing SOCS box protein 3 [Condylostylus longicornis]XP_055386489.1 SPRY domain-containing SOCS box protein 3 [Condylostylus longicornis]
MSSQKFAPNYQHQFVETITHDVNSAIQDAEKKTKKCAKMNIQRNPPLQYGVEDNWTWSTRHRSIETLLCGNQNRRVHFHSNWSRGTAAIRGNRILNNGRYYWELQVGDRVYGTSIMFGIGTENARLHNRTFTNMLGEDANGWGLSHKGVLWNNGIALMYTKPFRENCPTVIGLLFDGINGTLTYYKDGECLGVAFRGLDKVKHPLYPIVSSTAAKTEMTLINTRRDFVNLQDRCRAEIIKHIKSPADLKYLTLPSIITNYLAEAFNGIKPLRPVDNYDVLDF